MQEESQVRQNLMDDITYRGYCGNDLPRNKYGGCDNPRTIWLPEQGQFKCPKCSWISQFPEDFITRYRAKHNI